MKPAVDTAYLHFDETGSIPAIKHARGRKIGRRFASWAARCARAHIAAAGMAALSARCIA